MDTELLISEAKARFAHNSAKAYLKEKYEAKLIIAEQNGLWKADMQTISFLNSFEEEELVLIDTFNNLVKVDRLALLKKLKELNQSTMYNWYNEFKELETKR